MIKSAKVWIFVILIGIASGISCQKAAVPKPEEIRIGMVVYIDREASRIEMKNVAAMVMEEANKGGGLLVGDTRHRVRIVTDEVKAGVPEGSVTAVQRLINQENIVAIIGPQYSSDAIPSGEIAENSKIPLISPLSTNPKTTMGREYVFRMGFLDGFQGEAAAIFAIHDLGAENLAVFFDRADPYSRGIAEVFKKTVEEERASIVAFESFTTDQTEHRSSLESIKATRADILFLPLLALEAENIAQQADSLGLDVVLMGGDGWDWVDFQDEPEFDGGYCTVHWFPEIKGTPAESFVARYNNRFQDIPADTSALTYDAFMILIEAIKLKGSYAPYDIRDGLYELETVAGVSGPIDFVDSGDPRKGAIVLHFEEGRAHFQKTVEP